MPFGLTEEQQALRQSARQFAIKHVEPLAHEFDMTRSITYDESRDLLNRLLGHGIIDEAPLTEEGTVDLLAEAIVAEEIARVNASVVEILAGFLLAPMMLGPYFEADKTGRYEYLRDRRHVLSCAITEPEAGSNPGQIRSTARPSGDGGWIINASKTFITNATIADACIVMCRVEGRSGQNAIAPFMLHRDQFEGRAFSTLGWQACPTCDVFVTDAKVGPEAELGLSENGLKLSFQMLQVARCFVAVTAVGIAQNALDLAVAYAKQRNQFGKMIGSHQLVQQMLADMATEIDAGRLLVWRALELLQNVADAQTVQKEASMAKAYCTEMAVRVASMGIQVHGGMGLTSEYPAERLLRDARMITIPDGTTQIHKLIIGRELTGLSALT